MKCIMGTKMLIKHLMSFAKAVKEYIDYYNNKRIRAKTKWMPPVQYRKTSMCSA